MVVDVTGEGAGLIQRRAELSSVETFKLPDELLSLGFGVISRHPTDALLSDGDFAERFELLLRIRNHELERVLILGVALQH